MHHKHYSIQSTGKYHQKRNLSAKNQARKALKALGVRFREEYELEGECYTFAIPQLKILLAINPRSYHNRSKKPNGIKESIANHYGWILKRIKGSELLSFQIRRALYEASAEKIQQLLAEYPELEGQTGHFIGKCRFDISLHWVKTLIDIIPDFRDVGPSHNKVAIARQEGWTFRQIDCRQKIIPQFEEIVHAALDKLEAEGGTGNNKINT